MKKSLLSAAAKAAVVIAAGMATGCAKKNAEANVGAASSGAEKGDANKTLLVWSFTDELSNLIDKYYLPTHPDIEVQCAFTPSDQFTTKLDPVLGVRRLAPVKIEAAMARRMCLHWKMPLSANTWSLDCFCRLMTSMKR